jgi:HEAT repeat protein
MSARRGIPLPEDLTGVLREFVNAHAKASMYPPGHGTALEAARKFHHHLALALESRGSITFGFTPRAMLLDGTAIEPLTTTFRQFGAKLHRRGVGTIHFVPGLSVEEVGRMLSSVAQGDGEDEVAREGLRLQHLRVEPLIYDVLAFGDGSPDAELDEIFWSRLVEAALGRSLAEGEVSPSPAQIAAAIGERATASPEGARRVFEALSAFSSALASRGGKNVGSARRRFTEVLSALSRPATVAVMGGAPTRASRRRFMRETIESVPATLILGLIESAAEADGAPISEHLRWLLGKLAGQEAAPISDRDGDFATQVMGLLEQWDGENEERFDTADARILAEPSRLIALGLELDLPAPPVLDAARRWSAGSHLADLLQLLDHPGNPAHTRQVLTELVLDPGLLGRLLAESAPDWPLIGRVLESVGVDGVDEVLDLLDRTEDRVVRRRLIDLLVGVGPVAEDLLVDRLAEAEWHLARNILAVLARFPAVSRVEEVLPRLSDDDARVRLEAFKVLIQQEPTRPRALTLALESGEPSLVRTAMAALGGGCPPELVAPLLAVLGDPDDDMVMHAIRLVGESGNPLVVSPLLDLVRVRGGLFRRWRLAPTTPVMLSALSALARRWPNHRPVLPVLQMAARSGDEEVLRAMGAIR